jgi:hypothetical protein
MSIPRRRRTSIRTVIANLQRAIDELDERVTMLEEEDDWLETEEWSAPTTVTEHTGIGSTVPAVTITAESFANLINSQSINTSMSEGNVGIGSTATDGNIGVGTTTGSVGGGSPQANVGIGSTGTDGNVGVGSSTDGNVGVGT